MLVRFRQCSLQGRLEVLVACTVGQGSPRGVVLQIGNPEPQNGESPTFCSRPVIERARYMGVTTPELGQGDACIRQMISSSRPLSFG